MLLQLKNTGFGYTTSLIEDANASLNFGEVCLIIGNNGVGKTTMIKTILNQIPVLNGEILLEGSPVKQLSARQIAEKVSVVFSKAQIPVGYTVYDLISLGKYIHYPYYFNLDEVDKTHVEAIIQRLNLEQNRNTPLKNLSDGNLQKAFIGRALAQNSPIIILDEPTTHLDEENKITILQLLRNLAETENRLILFSSHDWRLAKEFSDEIWYIKNRKLQSGIAEDILISNPELSNPHFFDIHENFVAPQIFAPDFRKELLYSFLQKNFKNDLSALEFTFQNDFWVISYHNQQQIAHNFDEIKSIVQNLH